MTSPNYYQLAKQGDPDAIALYLNEKLSDRCLTTQAKRNEECLVLAIALKTVGDRETVVDLVRQELTALESRSITKVQIRATQDHQQAFAWEAEFDLEYPKPLPQLDLSLALDEEEEDPKDGLHKIGDVIRDRYRILEILGQGGNGITYAAMDLQQKTKVAIKALSLRHMNDWKQIELFEREAKVLSQLDHAAIPKYFDYFTIDTEEDRAFYIVQELAQGQNLAKLVEAGWRTNEKGVRKIAEQVLNILTYLHSLNPPVIHRDIKPHNLIYDDNGKVSLVDFGAVQDTYRSTMARGSTVIGTFGYMAPEQFRGQAVPATDLFSLGATILFILTHRSPSELPQERLRYDFRSKIQVSEQFADWLQKMVEPEIETRFISASESLTALQKKQIVWLPQRRLSWKAWLIIASIGSILTGFTITNKWMILEFYEIYPKICSISLGNETNKNVADIEELIEYARQRRKLSDKFPVKGNVGDGCLTANFNREVLDILSQRGIQIDYSTFLLSAKKTPSENLKKALEWVSSKNGNINVKDNDNDGESLLHFAVISKNKEIFKLLIQNGADINIKDNKGRTTLDYAILRNNEEIAKILIEKGADVNAKDNEGGTILRSALYNRRSIFKLLIEKGADINAKDNKGRTILHSALMSHGSTEDTIKLLIEKGADVNAKDNEGRTTLDYVVMYNQKTDYTISNFKLLIEKGADINAKDSEGRSLLHNAVLNNNIQIVKLLIKSKVNIDIKDRHGLTPLYYALGVYASTSTNKDTTILKILIANGADVSIKNNYGQTAFCYLVKDNKKDILKILIEKGYDPKSCK
jgi:serine/threonine protein kinase/ankyrin repeat protein